MANYFYNDSRSATADGLAIVTLADSDRVTFGTSAVWSSTGTGGVALALGTGNIATVNGQLYGDTAIAVSGNSTVLVGRSGIVSGFLVGIALQNGGEIDNYGYISGDDAVSANRVSRLYNGGVIAGVDNGIEFGVTEQLNFINDGTVSADVALLIAGTAAFKIYNQGNIQSTAVAIDAVYFNEITNTIYNSGTITGAIRLRGAASYVVFNSGLISGSVVFQDGDDVLDSSAGHLSGAVFGGFGDDILIGSVEGNRLSGDGGADELTGNGGDDVLNGGAGSDMLDGGDGVDIADYGGVGGSLGVLVDLASPNRNTKDAAGDTFTSIEGLAGSVGDDMLYGDAGANRLMGGAGNDLLDGRAGNDLLRGGLGDDRYVVDSGGDRVVEAADEGNDTVTSTVSYTLTDNVETLILGGRAAIDGHGNALANSLTGNGAANILDGGDGMDTIDGGKGADTMTGGAGWDTSYVDNAGDRVIEAPGDSNSDTVHTTISYTLPANVEILFLDGARPINGAGNAANNLVSGNAAANTIDGGSGNDQLSGGGGADRFAFSTALNAATNLDTIFDFVGATDKIQLSKAIFTAVTGNTLLSAAQFYVGTAAHDADDRIIYDKNTGNLFYDPDGNGAEAQVQFAILSHAILQPIPALIVSDFQLVG